MIKRIYRKHVNLTTVLMVIVFLMIGGALFNVRAEDVTRSNVFADIAEEADQGVVKVVTRMEVEGYGEQHPFYSDPFFRYFFGDQLPEMENEPRIREGFGSGFIVSEDGYIVTNQHVVNQADEVEVHIKGKKENVPAEVVWSDYSLDLAVLKVENESELSPLTLGNSDQIRPGDWAIAIGNPFEFEHTVTVGVISALGRPIQIPTGEGRVRTYSNLIQLDAAINPGNSGGPLLNIDGEVVGINTAVSTQGQGIGFAIPVNEIKGIVKDLKTEGEVRRPWLGIYFRNVNEEIQDYFDLEDDSGVMVVDVIEDSPAAEAGLRPYDVIIEIDQEQIKNTDDVMEIIENKEIGDRILLRVIREGRTEVIFARIGKKPNRLNQ